MTRLFPSLFPRIYRSFGLASWRTGVWWGIRSVSRVTSFLFALRLLFLLSLLWALWTRFLLSLCFLSLILSLINEKFEHFRRFSWDVYFFLLNCQIDLWKFTFQIRKGVIIVPETKLNNQISRTTVWTFLEVFHNSYFWWYMVLQHFQ